MDNALTILFRLLHIGGGIFWAGSLFATVRFVEPTARRTGPTGGQFMARLMGESRFGPAMGVAALVTVLSGAFLFFDSFQGSAFTGPMLGFSIGAIAGTAAWLIGFAVMMPMARKMAPLAARAAQGEDVGAEIGPLVARQGKWNGIIAWLVVIAVVTMATARYW